MLSAMMMMKNRSLLGVVITFSCSVFACTSPTEPPPPLPKDRTPGPNQPILGNPDEDKPTILWEDNFDGDKLDLNYWDFDVGAGGWGNNELQRYTRSNHKIEDGKLIIEAVKLSNGRYTSARIKTEAKIDFQYGRIEARIKLPRGAGVWPAFWMLGSDIKEVSWPDCGEIDIMEYVGKEPKNVHNNVHTPSRHDNLYNSNDPCLEKDIDKNCYGRSFPQDKLLDGFNVYAVEWTQDAISFYFNDRLTYVYGPTTKNSKNYPFNKRMFLILNLAIGGTFGGEVKAETEFPQQLIVDYVRVSELKEE